MAEYVTVTSGVRNGTNAADTLRSKESKYTGNNDTWTTTIYGGLNGLGGDDRLENVVALVKVDGGDGNDLIIGFDTNDTLSITGGSYSSVKSGDDVILTVDSRKISLIGAASLSKLNIKGTLDGGGSTTSTILTVTNSTKSPVTVDAAVKTINASSRTSAVKITGNAIANSISGGSGNDSLYGGAGADTFIYADGDGKDVIFGFENNDLLQITGVFSGTYNSSKKEIAFKVGSTADAITLKNFTATTFNINGDSYGISGTKLLKK